MTLDDARKIAEILVIVIAGVWTIFGFVVLKQRQKAVAEMRKVDLETRKLELDSRRIAVVHTEIVATYTQQPHNAGYIILAEVILENKGGRDTRIKWIDEPPAFVVRRASFDSSGAPTFDGTSVEIRARQARNPNSEPVSSVLRAGGTQRLAFAASVAQSGIYLLSFRGSVAPDDKEVSAAVGVGAHSPTSWTCTKFLAISESPEQFRH